MKIGIWKGKIQYQNGRWNSLQQLSHNGSVIDQTRHALNCKQPRYKQEHLLSENLGYLLFLELKWNTKTVFCSQVS